MRNFGSPSIATLGALVIQLLLGTLCLSQTISLSPNAGPPTTAIMLAGSGFPPGAYLLILFEQTKLATVHVDSTGAFSNVTIVVPASAQPGKYRILAQLPSGSGLAQTSFLVRTNWNQYQFAPDRTGVNPYENTLSPITVARLKLRWKFSVGGAIESEPIVADGIVYFGANDGNFYALNATTGALLWQYAMSGWVQASPTVVNGIVFEGGGGTVYAFHARTGALLWQSAISGTTNSSLVLNDTVYTTGAYGFVALDASSGVLLWQYDSGYGMGRSQAGGNGVVYVAGADPFDRSVYAFDGKTGELLWLHGDQVWTYTSPAVTNGVVYIGSYGFFNALDAATGNLLWQYTGGSWFDFAPAVANGMLMSGSEDGNVYALDANTGTLLWKYSTGAEIWSSPAFANGVLYASSGDGSLYALDSTGALLWKYSTGGTLYSSPAVANGMVYVGSEEGYLYAFGLPAAK